MMKIFGNIIEIFVYSAVYMIIALIAIKVIGAVFSSDFEKKISEENNIALALVCACVFIGLGIVITAILK